MAEQRTYGCPLTDVKRALRIGELVRVHEGAAPFFDGLAVCKSIITALPARIAPIAEGSTVGAIQELIAGEVERTLAALDGCRA